jgi:hypothetical protein
MSVLGSVAGSMKIPLGHIVGDLTARSLVKASPARTPPLNPAPASTQPSHIAIITRTDMSQQPLSSQRATPANVKPASLDFDPFLGNMLANAAVPMMV